MIFVDPHIALHFIKELEEYWLSFLGSETSQDPTLPFWGALHSSWASCVDLELRKWPMGKFPKQWDSWSPQFNTPAPYKLPKLCWSLSFYKTPLWILKSVFSPCSEFSNTPRGKHLAVIVYFGMDLSLCNFSSFHPVASTTQWYL